MTKNDIIGQTFAVKTQDDVKTVTEALSILIDGMFVCDRITLAIETEDGETTYGIECVIALDANLLIAGMFGNGQCKVFNPAEIEDLIEWLLEDIEIAVGEGYTITPTIKSV